MKLRASGPHCGRDARNAIGPAHIVMRPDSDVDIMIEIDPAARIGIYEYVAIKDFIAGLFDTRIDVVRRDRLKRCVQSAATRDAIYAFRLSYLIIPRFGRDCDGLAWRTSLSTRSRIVSAAVSQPLAVNPRKIVSRATSSSS